MASQKEIESTYDYMDRIFRRLMGDHGDITCAMYNGDFKLTLEEAQQKKHEYILNGIGFQKGDRVLDIGSGWGPMLKALKDAGGDGIGLTISPAQANNCSANGLHTELLDWKDAVPDEWVLGYLARFYPGSWLPNNLEQIQRCAAPYFRLVSENNGRLDYIQTLGEWGFRISKFSLSKFLFELKLVPRYMTSKNFRQQITSLRYSCNRLCFEREIMSHQRLVFEKIR